MMFTMEQNGFHGQLFKSGQPWEPQKVLIVCGGSDGNYKLTTLMAKKLCEQGIHTLALAYINAPGLPKNTIEAPIEPAVKAAEYLYSNGYSKVGIYGISSGGEYAQLAATYTNLITNVVAVSSPTAISQADNGISSRNTSCWSWQGMPLPYIPVSYSLIKALPKTIQHGELYTAHFYEQALCRMQENAWIKVERINGPVFYLTANQDSICPSNQFAGLAMQRLQKHNFPFNYRHVTYDYASHFLLPVEHSTLIPTKAIKMERKYPKECAASRLASLKETVQWLIEW